MKFKKISKQESAESNKAQNKLKQLFESVITKSENVNESIVESLVDLGELNYRRLEIDEYEVFIFFTTVLLEKKRTNFGGIYSAIEHPPRLNPGFKHIHLFARGEEIGALNVNGSTHDSWHEVQLPKKVVSGIKKHYPKYIIPKNGLLEFLEPSIGKLVLFLESLS